MNVQSQLLPSVINKWTFQDHLPSKPIIYAQSSCLQAEWPFQDIF